MDKTVKITIAEAVKQILSAYPYMNEFLLEECVNHSALAQKILPEVKRITGKKTVNKEAIIMSSIRYAKSLKGEKLPDQVRKSIAKKNVMLKTDLTYFTLAQTPTNLKIVESLHKTIRWEKGEIFFLTQGINELAILMDKSTYKLLTQKIPTHEIDVEYGSAASIILHGDEPGAPGLTHHITKPMAKAGIDIEFFGLKRDAILIMKEEDASRVFEMVKNLIDECRKLS